MVSDETQFGSGRCRIVSSMQSFSGHLDPATYVACRATLTNCPGSARYLVVLHGVGDLCRHLVGQPATFIDSTAEIGIARRLHGNLGDATVAVASVAQSVVSFVESQWT